jgi:L-threonylcarbamoyladenylate synthase
MAQLGTDITRAANLLVQGELVAIPTETVYGLAANALDEKAVVKIFEVKNRPAFDPLIVHVQSVDCFDRYARHIPENAMLLAEKVCPGPITFVFDKKAVIPDLVTSGHPTVALRVPNHALTLRLLQRLDFPLAAPSANPFGFVSPTTAMHVNDQLGEKLEYILDGGPCQVGLESTIIDFSNNKKEVLRLGGMSLEFLEEILGEKLAVKTSSSNPKAPGMLISHYNPGKKVLVGHSISELLHERIDELAQLQIGILAFKNYHPGIDKSVQRVLSPSGNVTEAAKNFFTMLREFNTHAVDVVLAEWLPNEGLGRAINDRLKRASAK